MTDEARKALQEAIEKSKNKECKGGTCVIISRENHQEGQEGRARQRREDRRERKERI